MRVYPLCRMCMHVAILHDVFLAFKAERALGARGGFRAGGQQVVPADGFGADEVMLQVGVDGSGGLRGLGAGRHRPGAALVFAGGEEADEAEQFVALADEADQTALVEAVAGQEFGGLFVVHLGQLGFDFAADGGGSGVGAVGDFVELEAAYGGVEIVAERRAFADVKRI